MAEWQTLPNTNHEHLVLYGKIKNPQHCLFIVVGYDPNRGYFWDIPMFGRSQNRCSNKEEAKQKSMEVLKGILMVATANTEPTIEQE